MPAPSFTPEELNDAYRVLAAANGAGAGDAAALLAFEDVGVGDFAGGSLAEPRWAVERVWPEGAMGVIAGRPKDGKSTHAVELAVSLWSGTAMWGLEEFPVRTRPAPVLYVQQENADARVQGDLQAVLAARGLGSVEREELRWPDGTVGAVIDHFELDATNAFLHLDREPDFRVLSHAGIDLSQPAHRDWLWRRVEGGGFRYVFLDPLYMLIGAVDEKDSAQLKPILIWLTRMKNELGCAAVVTHHMSDKGGRNEAATMLGTTYIHGWYEAALFTRRGAGAVFHVKADALRGVGTVEDLVLTGLGVGDWEFAEGAQGRTDATGRAAPNVAAAEAKANALQTLEASHPDWDDDRLRLALGGVSPSTLKRYRRRLRQRRERDGTE